MWEKIKSNRAAKFVVGLALVVVGVNWLMSGSLVLAAQEMIYGKPPMGEDGKTAFVAPSPWLETIISTAVSVIVALGGYLMGAAEWLFKTVKGAVTEQTSVVTTVAVSPSVAVPVDSPAEPLSTKQLVIDLGRAAFENDPERLETIRWAIRMPQAIAELSEAYRNGDLETVAARQEELDAKLAKPKATKKGGASNG